MDSNRKRSQIWKHFSVLNKDRAKCQYCFRIISYTGGGTGNLTRHFKKLHGAVPINEPTCPLPEATLYPGPEQSDSNLTNASPEDPKSEHLTWRYVKWNTKKRAMKQQQSFCDKSLGTSSDDGEQNTQKDTEEPSKKRFVSFDEEIVQIERDKLELEREYKIQKIEVLSRIAAALEELANK